jgi:hypothetical protein
MRYGEPPCAFMLRPQVGTPEVLRTREARPTSACRLQWRLPLASKGGRINAALPMQNEGEGFLHCIHFVWLTFHFDGHVFFVARAA